MVIAATGVLHHPHVAEIPGLETFAGASFHSARWGHTVPLDGRRVGVIGTGSAAVQITSALASRAAKYKLFQRTGQWIMPIENQEYSPVERAQFAADPASTQALRAEMHHLMISTLADVVIEQDSEGIHKLEEICRQNLETGVYDPILRERLRPSYRAACKRIIFSSDFYAAIQHPNAELVTAGIERIDLTGVRTADGVLHELDVLVVATGFRADRFIRQTLMRGRGGVDLDDVWADRPIAYLSLSTAIPEFFHVERPEWSGRQFLADSDCRISTGVHSAAHGTTAQWPVS